MSIASPSEAPRMIAATVTYSAVTFAGLASRTILHSRESPLARARRCAVKHAADKQNGKADRKSGDAGSLKGKAYEKELRRLQAELCHLQEWVKAEGERIVIVFEGRDAAGKGGTIKAITERVSPRVFRLVALPAPSDR